jgi:hypothetical protein
MMEDGAIAPRTSSPRATAARGGRRSRCAFGNKMGVVFNTDAECRPLLFAPPRPAALVVEVEQAALPDVTEKVNCVVLGMITTSRLRSEIHGETSTSTTCIGRLGRQAREVFPYRE